MRSVCFVAGIVAALVVSTALMGEQAGPKVSEVGGTITAIDGAKITLTHKGDGKESSTTVTVGAATKMLLPAGETEPAGDGKSRPKMAAGKLSDLKVGMKASATVAEGGVATQVTVAPVEAAPATQKKPAVPTGQALKDATSLVNEVYKDDFVAAKTAEQRKALVRKLLDGARDEKGAGRYALLSRARNVAIEVGDVEGCAAALDGISESFEVDALSEKQIAYTYMVHSIAMRMSADRKRLADEVAATVQAAIVADRYDAARAAAEIGLTNARSSSDPALIKLAVTAMEGVREAETAFAEVQKSIRVLADKPRDPEANLKVGQYLCFMRGDWKNGLPMLALGNDAALKALADKEVAGVTTVDDQVRLGDGWWEVGEKLTGAVKRSVLGRAARWYNEALPSLGKGLVKAKVAKRLEELAAMASVQSDRKPIPAQICAACDDRFEIYVNGSQALVGGINNAEKKDLQLASGDVVTVKCVNDQGRRGFACVIKFKSGAVVATGTSVGWRSYLPRDPKNWFNPNGLGATGTVQAGDNADVAAKVSQASGAKATSIWGGRDTCYLVLTIR